MNVAVDSLEARFCYHCGLPIPPRTAFSVRVEGCVRSMCCAGCQSVAQAILDNGLIEYYRHRDAMPESPREALPRALADLGLFDHPEFQKTFVRPIGEHEREAALILEGITCAACVWLNEKHIAQQRGVSAVDINYATRRARVRWDDRRIKLSDILAAIAAIGYQAHPYDPGRTEQLAQKERSAALWRVFVAGFGMMQVMMYAFPAYVAEAGTMTPDIESLLRWASLILTLPVVLYSAGPFFRSAWRDLRLCRVGMDVPVALGVGSAFAASAWATVATHGEVYFDSVTMFVFLLLGGRFLEMLARQKAVRGVEQLAKLQPAFAERVAAQVDGGFERVTVASLVVGDYVLVKAGDVFPTDGVVFEGQTHVDEALLTGESRPLPKQVGDSVTGGSVNRDSPVLVRVTSVGEATRLAAIRQLMERAQSEKPHIVTQADRVAAYFVAVLLVLAMLTGASWYVIDPTRALWVFVSVLVVSCPCALSLATPVALTVATGRLSLCGLLVTRGQAIETMARATHFVFDKTGTLTQGRLRLVATQPFGGASSADALGLAADMEGASEHAVGDALRHAAIGLNGSAARITNTRATPGLGIEADVEGIRYRIGRPGFVEQLAGRLPAEAEASGEDGASLVGLGSAAGWVALFRFEDELRPSAAGLIQMLRQTGISVSILSGDTPGAVATVARRLGVENACSGLTPQGKYEHVVELQRRGAVVAMVGDGVNDAPVLAKAQVSVAMGQGTELAHTQADFVLLSDDLDHLREGISIARCTLRVIHENLLWAFAYNVLAIPAAMMGWITPWMAGIGMSASSLFVVLNALRLQSDRRWRIVRLPEEAA